MPHVLCRTFFLKKEIRDASVLLITVPTSLGHKHYVKALKVPEGSLAE